MDNKTLVGVGEFTRIHRPRTSLHQVLVKVTAVTYGLTPNTDRLWVRTLEGDQLICLRSELVPVCVTDRKVLDQWNVTVSWRSVASAWRPQPFWVEVCVKALHERNLQGL